MNWAWVSSLDHIWRSPTFPMWLTLAAAGFFGIIVLVTLLRADRSVANGALTVITLLSIGVAGDRDRPRLRHGQPGRADGGPLVPPTSAALPQLSCIDDLAGEAVLTACEKVLFGSAEFGRGGRRLCGLPDHAADRSAMSPPRTRAPARPGGAASRRRARSLRTGGLCAADPRPLHAGGMRGLPLADQQQPDRRQYGRARL